MDSILNYKNYYFWLIGVIVSSLFFIWYSYRVIVYKDIFVGICGLIFLGLMIYNYSRIKPIKNMIDNEVKKEILKGLK